MRTARSDSRESGCARQTPADGDGLAASVGRQSMSRSCRGGTGRRRSVSRCCQSTRHNRPEKREFAGARPRTRITGHWYRPRRRPAHAQATGQCKKIGHLSGASGFFRSLSWLQSAMSSSVLRASLRGSLCHCSLPTRDPGFYLFLAYKQISKPCPVL